MAISPKDVPTYLVLEPRGGIRLDLRLPTNAVEISAALESPKPGRSFVLMIGAPGEPFVQRARIASRAKLHYEPGRPGLFVILLTNPMQEPAVVRLRLRPLGPIERPSPAPANRPRARARRR